MSPSKLNTFASRVVSHYALGRIERTVRYLFKIFQKKFRSAHFICNSVQWHDCGSTRFKRRDFSSTVWSVWRMATWPVYLSAHGATESPGVLPSVIHILLRTFELNVSAFCKGPLLCPQLHVVPLNLSCTVLRQATQERCNQYYSQ